jgi:hypothetical protein
VKFLSVDMTLRLPIDETAQECATRALNLRYQDQRLAHLNQILNAILVQESAFFFQILLSGQPVYQSVPPSRIPAFAKQCSAKRSTDSSCWRNIQESPHRH